MTKGFVGSLAFIAIFLMLSPRPGPQAATVNIADGDVAGLIAAINTANTNPGADTINLAPGGTYTLTAVDNPSTGLPIITSQIIINGNGATIQRSSAVGTPDFRIIQVTGPNAGDLTLNGVTITGGHLVGNPGGGIYNNSGTLKLISTLVTGNAGDGGAGIFNVNGAVELINSSLNANIDRFFGAGIWNDGSDAIVTLTNSSITGNTGRLRGTGIYNLAGTATLINSTVSGNIHGAGIHNHLAGSKLTLINSTVSGNGGTAANDFGGILNEGGTAVLVNSTVTGNTATTGDAGIQNDSGTTSLKNTIVANNSPADCVGVITTLGHHIVSDASCGLAGTGDLNSTNPLLGPLANNGGPTQTHALLLGSPAIDAVPLADCTDANGVPIATDQRGVARPQGAACDIGAYEVGATTCLQPPSGMVAWWPGDGNANDIIANHNGILEGSVTFAPGKVGLAFQFNGSQSDGVNLGDVADFDFTPTSSFSVDAWINISALAIPPDDGQNIVILNYACSNTVQALAIQITGKAFFLVRDVNGLESLAISPSAVSINTWHHIAGVRDVTGAGKMVKLFIDGALVASAPDMSTGSLVNNVPDYIGRRNTCGTNNPFNGLVDEVEIFNRALTGCEIQAIYNAGSAGKCQTVVTPTQAVQNLITAIGNMGLPGGVATSLTAPLSNINTNNQAAACGKLDAFINEVNAKVQNGQLTSCQASQLLQAANAIKASLGC